MRALVRFAAPTVPAGCVLSSAKLQLYADSYTTGRTIQALRVAATWAEGSVRWSNQPATTGAAATLPSGNTKAYREWLVTDHVRAMVSANAHHGFLVRDAVENSGSAEQQYFAREKGQNPPRLVLTYAPAPADTTPPETSIASGPTGTTTSSSASFTFASNDPSAKFECALDGAPYAPCASSIQLTGLTTGVHRLLVRARDEAGNVDTTPATREWTLSGG